MLFTFTTPFAVGATTIAEQVFSIAPNGDSGSVGYLSFSLPNRSIIDIAASGPFNAIGGPDDAGDLDPELVLFQGLSPFTFSDILAEAHDTCDPIDCGEVDSGSFWNEVINDIPLNPGVYTVAVSTFPFNASDAVAGVNPNSSSSNILLLVGDNNLIIPGTGTGTGTPRLIAFSGLNVFNSSSVLTSGSTNQTSTITAVNSICNTSFSGASSLDDRCMELLGMTPEQQSIAASAITPEEINVIGSIAVATAQVVSSTGVYSRLNGLRKGNQKKGGMTISGLSSEPVYIAAGDLPEIYKRLGVFINASGSFGTKNTGTHELGYGFGNASITIGSDYAFTDNLLLGAAFTYRNVKAEFARNSGDVTAHSYSGSIYGTFNYQDFYTDGLFSIGSAHTDITRNIIYSTPTAAINTRAFGNTDAMEYKTTLSSGYNFFINRFNINPYVGFQYTKTATQGFDESGGMGWAIHYDSQDIESIQSSVGARFAYIFDTNFGVIIPQASAEWIHEYGYNQRVLNTHFIQDLNKTKFQILSDKPDRDFMTASFNVQGQFAHDISGFLGYDIVLLRENVSNHTVTAGIRMQF